MKLRSLFFAGTASLLANGRLKAAIVLTAALFFTGATGTAHSTIIFTQGNNPQPGEEDILLTLPQSGTTIAGTTNQTGTDVQFTSSQILTAGLSVLGPTSPATTISSFVTFAVPGGDFTDYIFNAEVSAGATGGDATLSAVSNDGTLSLSFTLGNGNNFFTITTADGEFLTSVTLTPDANVSYTSYQDFRVSGASAGVSVVPEPASLAFFAPALLGLGFFARRKRKTS